MFIYMMSSRDNRVLYTGVTNDLARRVQEHRLGIAPGFTKKYKADKLVYYEEWASETDAIAREKQLKGWLREKKNRLVERLNPAWNDLMPWE